MSVIANYLQGNKKAIKQDVSGVQNKRISYKTETFDYFSK